MKPAQVIEDVREIEALKHAYCWSYDTADLDRLLSLFAVDAVCDFGEVGLWEGHEQIRAAYREQMARSGVPGSRMHSVSNPWIEVDGDEARGRWYLTDLHTVVGGREPVKILGWYDDQFRRVDGRWLISRTSTTVLWTHSTVDFTGSGPRPDPVSHILDERAIEDVIAQYAVAIDSQDWEALRAVFTEDCIASYPLAGERHGPDAIVNACQAAVAHLDATQHLMANVRVTVSADTAVSRTSFVAQHVRGDGQHVIAGTYTDGWMRTPDGWRIATRRMDHSWTAGDPTVMSPDLARPAATADPS